MHYLDEMGGPEKNRSSIKNWFNRCLCVVKKKLKCSLRGKKQTTIFSPFRCEVGGTTDNAGNEKKDVLSLTSGALSVPPRQVVVTLAVEPPIRFVNVAVS